MPTRLLIADHDEGFRRLVKRLLGESVTVVGDAADGEDAVKLALEGRPELVLMDIALPKLDGVAVTRRIKTELPDVKVILLTSRQEEAYLNDTGKSGADLLLPKQSIRAEIVSAIRTILPDFARHWDGSERRHRRTASGRSPSRGGDDRRHPLTGNGRAV